RQRRQRDDPPLAGTAQRLRPTADAAGIVLLDDGVPFAAGVTLARPARGDVAAGLADELRARFSHAGSRQAVLDNRRRQHVSMAASARARLAGQPFLTRGGFFVPPAYSYRSGRWSPSARSEKR